VLRRHCSGCHGEKAPRADLRVLDHALLLNDRKVITPRSPGSSELLTLIEVGSMPPGTQPKVPEKDLTVLRDWVLAGAPAFPPDFGELYVLHKVVEDLRGLRRDERRQARYLSLNHLRGNEKAAPHLAAGREALRQLLGYLAVPGKKPPSLIPVDEPAGTIFRINLQDLGWDRHPYEDNNKKEVSLNLFDLALLEYPDCVLPTGSPLFAELSGLLGEMRQVRPIPYVRADWLAGELSGGPLHDDFLKALEKPPEVTLPPAVATFLEGVKMAGLDPKKPRDRPISVSSPDSVPIIPLDGVTQLEHNPDSALQVEVKLVKYDAPHKAPEKFFVGDQIGVVITASQDVFIELIWVTEDGVRLPLQIGREARVVEANGKALISPPGEGYRLLPTPGKNQIMNQIILYAYPNGLLKRAGRSFPDGERLHARGKKGPADRILHPIYQIAPEGGPVDWLDMTKMVKRTVPLTILAK
jgi:hypothetical protein